MSTKALFLALEKLDSIKGVGNPWTQPAWEELKAIDEAALAWASRGAVVHPAQMAAFWALLERIGADAAQRNGGTTGDPSTAGASGPQE